MRGYARLGRDEDAILAEPALRVVEEGETPRIGGMKREDGEPILLSLPLRNVDAPLPGPLPLRCPQRAARKRLLTGPPEIR